MTADESGRLGHLSVINRVSDRQTLRQSLTLLHEDDKKSLHHPAWKAKSLYRTSRRVHRFHLSTSGLVRSSTPKYAPFPLPGTDVATLLYIEDNESIRQLVRFILSRRDDMQMIEAATGQDGLTQASSAQPDIILIDISLPDMTGNEVLKQLKAQDATAAIPTIAISGDSITHTQSTSPGFNAYLSKPLNMTIFYQTIDRLLS